MQTPSNKITAVALAGAATVIIVFIAATMGLAIPAYVGSAITLLATFGFGYLIKDSDA